MLPLPLLFGLTNAYPVCAEVAALDTFKVKRSPNTTVRGGRVQSSTGLAHVLKKDKESANVAQESLKRPKSYKHSLDSPQMVELNELVADNRDLKAINHEFLQNACNFMMEML